MTAPLSGKHALITGAGRGIGAAITQALAGAGANVTLLGRSLETLESAAKSLGAVKTFCIEADVAQASAVKDAVAAAREALGPVAILVNNAGKASSAPLHKSDDELWKSMLAVNLTGVFNCMRECLPDMLKSGYGRIVNVASTAGLVGYRYVSAYSAAKHGVIGLTRSAALEVATRGITVNAVCPGYTETDLLAGAVSNIVSSTGLTQEAARAELLKDNPQRRFVLPAEVANAVLWLCAPGSDAITGQAIAVAGGEV
jgi:NAD(P)-dependent dehydrogenase (short-subunit alcohol dehydrogenase family)